MWIVFVTPTVEYIHRITAKKNDVFVFSVPENCLSVSVYASILDIKAYYKVTPKEALQIIREGYFEVKIF